MMTLSMSLLALLFSMLCFVLLMKSDRKRHRRCETLLALPANYRPWLACLSVSPFLVFIYLGSLPALFIWLGGITLIGWLLVMLPKKIC